MTINLTVPDIREMRPRITVFGVGGAGGNAVNNMITAGLAGRRLRRRQHRRAGADDVEGRAHHPNGRAGDRGSRRRLAARGRPRRRRRGDRRDPRSSRRRRTWCSSPPAWAAAPAPALRPSSPRSRASSAFSPSAWSPSRSTSKASAACALPKPASSSCRRSSIRCIVIPNQNLFRVANEKTTFADAFAMADQVLYSGVACITDLMVKEGLINLDFADVRAVMKRDGQGDDGHRRGLRREARAHLPPKPRSPIRCSTTPR